jgi:hypothetical protein
MGGELKLPELEQRFIRGFYRPIEYFIDPAILRRLGDDVLQQIVRIELRFQAEAAKLEAQKFGQMADALGK